jgi:hypothetical protein
LAVERLLRRSVEIGRQAEVSPACLDAETFAAWTDGAMQGTALAAVETHVAGCARCQSMAALMMRTSPPAPVAAPWWRSLRSPWLVPLTAGVAAVAIWSVVPGPTRTPLPPDAPVNAPVERAAPDAKAESQPTDSNRQTADGKRQPPDSRQPPDGRRQTAADNTAPATGNRQPSASNRKPADGRLQADSRQRADERREAASPLPAVAAAPPAPAAAAPARSAAEAPAAARAGAAGALLKRGAFARDVQSPDPAVRWRLGAKGLIERTEDGGATWTMLTTGVTVELTAGASPSPEVCWVVGRNGTVLRSTDGRTWTGVNIPEGADLVSVEATDASIAVVTTTDGRRYQTSDGGGSWVKQA